MNSNALQILGKLFPDARGALQKISSELSSALERVTSKEKYLSSSFSHLVQSTSMHVHCDSHLDLTPSHVHFHWFTGIVIVVTWRRVRSTAV